MRRTAFAAPRACAVKGTPRTECPKTLVLTCEAATADGEADPGTPDMLATEEGSGAPPGCAPLPEHAASSKQARSETREVRSGISSGEATQPR